MASSDVCTETEIDELRQEILSYKPGTAILGDDQRVASLCPDKLVIYLVDVTEYEPEIVSKYLRSALLKQRFGQPTARCQGVDRQESTFFDRKMHLTDWISLITHDYFPGGVSRHKVEKLSEKVGCFIVAIGESGTPLWQFLMSDWVEPIRDITGRSPIFVILCDLGKKLVAATIEQLKSSGISDIYEVPYAQTLSLPEQIEERDSKLQEKFEQGSVELLKMLQQCLVDGDKRIHFEFAKKFGEMCKEPAYRKIYEHAWKASKRAETVAKIRKDEEEKKHQKQISDLRKRYMDEMLSKEEAWKKKLEAKDEDIRNLKDIVQKTWRSDEIDGATMYRVKQLQEGKEERAIHKVVKHSPKSTLQREIEAKSQLINTLTEKKKEAERALTEEIRQLKLQGREEQRAKHEEEKGSLKAELKISMESEEQRMTALTKIVMEMEQTEAANRQEVEQLKSEQEKDKTRHQNEMLTLELKLKREVDANNLNKRRVKQLKKEIQKLRNKIQVESEIRSENKKKPQMSEWVPNFITFVMAKLQQDVKDTTKPDMFEENLEDHARSEPPNDEFAEILKKIADHLYEETKIDSLGGQLGILQGDIERALMTNVRFNRVTSEGTRHMLKQWRRGVSREDERFEMRRALEAAKLLDIADRYLPRHDDITLEKDGGQQLDESKYDRESQQKYSEEATLVAAHQDLEYSKRVPGSITKGSDSNHGDRGVVFQTSDPSRMRQVSDPNELRQETRSEACSETDGATNRDAPSRRGRRRRGRGRRRGGGGGERGGSVV